MDAWEKLRDGIQIRRLAKSQSKGLQIDIIRLEPNLRDRPHTHNDFEWVYVLEGQFQDEKGVHKKGDFLVNTTEGVHQPIVGPQGATLLIVWSGKVKPLN
jgi:anti-sigma factor ChrR (cupin superfamily)